MLGDSRNRDSPINLGSDRGLTSWELYSASGINTIKGDVQKQL